MKEGKKNVRKSGRLSRGVRGLRKKLGAVCSNEKGVRNNKRGGKGDKVWFGLGDG